MKVQLKNVKANPFRKIDHYPLNNEKIEALKKSINQTGFWDNLVGREQDGEIQIAYGHHRLNAAKQVLGGDYEMDLNIRELDNATMIQIMANENMSEWSSDIKIIDESVRVAREYLEKIFGDNKVCKAEDVAKFLGWPIGRVNFSFQRYSAIEKGDISKENLNKFKDTNKVSNFIAEIKKHDFTEREIDRLATKVNDEDTSRHEIKDLIKKEAFNKRFNNKEDKKASEEKQRVLKFHNFYGDIKNEAMELGDKVVQLEKFAAEFKDADETNIRQRARVVSALETLKKEIESLLTTLRK